eukprot:scaffold94607_cov27-Tisochrysis_lutea.AAC.4
MVRSVCRSGRLQRSSFCSLSESSRPLVPPLSSWSTATRAFIPVQRTSVFECSSVRLQNGRPSPGGMCSGAGSPALRAPPDGSDVATPSTRTMNATSTSQRRVALDSRSTASPRPVR